MASFAYTNLICNLLAFFALGSAILTISVGNSNPVNAVLWLIVSFVAVACYLITAGMTFMGLSYIIVYVGAIAVLFLFVVIMLNIVGVEQGIAGVTRRAAQAKGVSNTWPLATLIVLIGIFVIIPMALIVDFHIPVPILSFINDLQGILYYGDTQLNLDQGIASGFDRDKAYWTNAHSPEGQISTMNQVQALGLTLYTHGALWLLIISILLLLAILAPLALAFTS